MSSLNILQLVSVIQTNITKYSGYLTSQGYDLPPADTKTPAILPSDIEAARHAAAEATYELRHLILGPVGYLLEATSEQFSVLALRFICKHKIIEKIPLEGSVSIEKIANQCSLDRHDVRRFIHLAIANRILRQTAEEQIAHNPVSMALVHNPYMMAWISNATQNVLPSVDRLVEAIEKWPGAEEPANTAYAICHGLLPGESVFDDIDKEPQKAKAFADAMAFWLQVPGFEPDRLCDDFDFAALRNGVVVELGASEGQSSIAIARRYPEIRCIVQDLGATVNNTAKSNLSLDIRDRVSFMKHSFWDEQPIKGADIYLFRWTLHDWSNAAATKILKNLVPAMKPGAKVLISDNVIPAFGTTSTYLERGIRGLDMTLKAFSNGLERTVEGWVTLFALADPRFKFLGVSSASGGHQLALISAEWKDQASEILTPIL